MAIRRYKNPKTKKTVCRDTKTKKFVKCPGTKKRATTKRATTKRATKKVVGAKRGRKPKSFYRGRPPTTATLEKTHKARPLRQRKVDEGKKAKIIYKPGEYGTKLWMTRPNRSDVYGIDYKPGTSGRKKSSRGKGKAVCQETYNKRWGRVQTICRKNGKIVDVY